MADHQLPSLHGYSEAITGARKDITTETASLLSGRRDTDDDADLFAESKDKEEPEANETVLEDC